MQQHPAILKNLCTRNFWEIVWDLCSTDLHECILIINHIFISITPSKEIHLHVSEQNPSIQYINTFWNIITCSTLKSSLFHFVYAWPIFIKKEQADQSHQSIIHLGIHVIGWILNLLRSFVHSWAILQRRSRTRNFLTVVCFQRNHRGYTC